jgi:hypothetical protein
MDDRTARLNAHQKNIDRYQRLLKTKLNEVESQYLEKRLSEERFWMAMLNIPTDTPSMWRDLPTALE